MKHYLFLLCIGITLLGCSNDDDEIRDAELVGNWNWIEASGGIDGITETPKSTGNTILLEISNSTVKKYVNGNLESERNYSTEVRESLIFGESKNMIIYQNGINQTILLTEDNLTLYDECNDCYQNEYSRK